MKKALLAIGLISSVAMAGTAFTAYAAEKDCGTTTINGCFKVYVCKNARSLSQVLEDCKVTLKSDGTLCVGGNVTVLCPGVDQSDAKLPEIQVPPCTQTPPSTEAPDTQEPDTQEPPAAGTPDIQEPDTQEPPVVETPDTDVSDKETLSYAEQVVKLVNEERAKAGLAALEVKTDITAAANVRAKEIKQLFSHTRPNGSSFSSALKEQGVSYRSSGENIAWGQKTPEQVMNGWMNSSGHRTNILNKNFKNIGVGYYQDANGVKYWVQLFTY